MKNNYRIIKTVKYAEIKPTDEILDLGSGNNILLKYLPKNKNYTSIDLLGEPTIKHNLEDGLPPNIINKFDKIFLLEFIEHIENFKTILRQCKDYLKDNGKIIITTPTNRRYMKNEYYKDGSDIYGNLADHYHCFRYANLINLANWLNMDYKIIGVNIRIPFLNIFIPSNQTIYNDTWLMILEEK